MKVIQSKRSLKEIESFRRHTIAGCMGAMLRAQSVRVLLSLNMLDSKAGELGNCK